MLVFVVLEVFFCMLIWGVRSAYDDGAFKGEEGEELASRSLLSLARAANLILVGFVLSLIVWIFAR